MSTSKLSGLRSRCSIAFLVAALAGSTGAAAQDAAPAVAASPAQASVPSSVPATDASAASQVPQLTYADLSAWLDGFMPNAIKQGDIAGAVVVVVKDGAILVQRGYGYADVDAEKPMDPEHTLVRPGSVSKLITWTALMQVIEQGKVDLDADVNQYIDFKIPALDGKPVTVRNVLTHTTGFEESLKNLISEEGNELPGFDALLKEHVPARIFAPGTTPAYSNYGASLAGYIVQRVSGMSFDDYVEKHIFAPLGMNSTTFRQPLPADWKPRMAQGYKDASHPAAQVRTGRRGTGGQRQHDGRGHGALHDRAPAAGQVWRGADPAARDRAVDARHALDDPAAGQPDGARFLRVQLQGPPHDCPRRRHGVVPQRPEPVPRRRRGPVRLGQQPRQGRRRAPAAQHAAAGVCRPLLPGDRTSSRRRWTRRPRASTPRASPATTGTRVAPRPTS